jgi:hypothetical protein
VAQHLIAAFQNSKNTGMKLNWSSVFKKSEHTGKSIRRRLWQRIAALLDADLYIIVSDMQLCVAAELPLKPISCSHLREYGFRCFT